MTPHRARCLCTGIPVSSHPSPPPIPPLQVFDLVTSGPDSDSLDGFNNVPQWFENGRKYAPSDCILFLAGTHLDEYLAIDKRQEDRDGAEAKLHAMVKASLAGWGLGAVPFFAVSAKDGTNVQELMTDMGGRWMARKIVRTRQLLVQASQWGVKSTLMLDVPIEKAEEESAGPDVVTAGNVAAAFVKTHKEATLKDVIVARNRSHDRNVPGASQSAAPPLPLTHAAVTELPPSGGGGLLFRLLRRQPLTAGLHCEFYNAAVQHVTKVILEEADGGSGRKLTGYASDGTYVTLDEDDPQWLPINAAKRLGVKYRLPQDSNRTWERFLAEKDARAAPITCFRVIGTLNDLVNECQAAAAVS